MEMLKVKDRILAPLVRLLPRWISPNSLAWFRLFLVIPLFYLAWLKLWPWALGIFLFAYATDLIDGVLARSRNQVTVLGAILDPVADRMVFLIIFVLAAWGRIDPRIFGLLFALEILILIGGPVLSLIAKPLHLRRQIGSNIFGKLKTLFEVVGIVLVILSNSDVNGTLILAHVAFIIAIGFLLLSFGRHLLSKHNID